MSSDKDLDAIFGAIANSKDLDGTRVPRPGIGKHTLVLSSYFVQASKKDDDGGNRLIAEFVTLESNVPGDEAGSVREWPWFIQASGNQWTKKYEQDRSKKFLKIVAESIGEEGVTAVLKTAGIDFKSITSEADMIQKLGMAMVKKAQPLKGLVLNVEVVRQGDKLDKNGNPYTSAIWAVAGQQSMDEIKASASELGQSAKEEETPAKEETKAAEPAAGGAAGGASRFRFGGK